MPRFDYIYTNFSAGEFSPLLEGRVDLEKYRSGCITLENFIPRPHGPAVGRGGLRFINETKDSSKLSRLIPFDAGSGSGLYHIEFGDLYIRFFTEDGLLEELSVPTEVVTTYTEAELFDLYYVQDANTLYLFHNDHPPAELVRNDTYDWVLSDMSFTGIPSEWIAGNYPGCATFYEQRMFYGGCPGDPSVVWGSKTAEYTTLTEEASPTDEDAVKYQIFTDKINLTEWMSAGEILALGTSGGEYKMTSTSFNEAITPSNIKVVRQTNYGSAKIMPIRIGNRVVFVQKGQLKVRSFSYRLDSDSYASEDLTLLSEHITKPNLVESDYSNEPDSIAYYIRSDGQLVGLSYEPEINISAWFRLVTDGDIESVSVTDGWADPRYDDIMVIVNRYIDGGIKRYVEKLERPKIPSDLIEDSFYVDSGLTYDGVPANVISGFDHLEGEFIRVLVDGSTHPDVEVIGGDVTLQRQGSKVHGGLGYNPTLKSMRIEGGSRIGTAQGKTKRINKTQVRVFDTVGITINGERYHMGPPVMDEAVQPFSGDIEVDLDDGYETEGQLEIIQDQPLPITVVAIMPEARTR